MVAEDWWREFFTGVSVDMWLRAATPEMTRAEVDFIEKSLDLAPSSTVLDVPCGGGRHSLELAARGHRVTGVDFSQDFLNVARAQATTAQTAVRWEQREMRDLPWAGTFDGAFCFGNSFGYLTDDGNRSFLTAVASALKPGGKFAIQTGIIAESILPVFQERRWYQVADILFLIANRYDHCSGRLETDYTFVRDGKTDTRPGSQRVYTYRELASLLAECGFGGPVLGLNYQGNEPFRLGAQGCCLVATRTSS